MFTNGRLFAAASLLLVVPGCATLPRGASPSSFEAAVERNLAAVSKRDYDALAHTITSGDRLLLIFPDGRITFTRAEYLSFHREWFADTSWTMKFERIAADVSGSYGHALYRTTYDGDGSGPGQPRSSYLTLGFRLEEGQWRLLHDQNTRVTVPQ